MTDGGGGFCQIWGESRELQFVSADNGAHRRGPSSHTLAGKGESRRCPFLRTPSPPSPPNARLENVCVCFPRVYLDGVTSEVAAATRSIMTFSSADFKDGCSDTVEFPHICYSPLGSQTLAEVDLVVPEY